MYTAIRRYDEEAFDNMSEESEENKHCHDIGPGIFS